MDTTRLILIVALAVVTSMLWEQWQHDYGHPPATTPKTTTAPQPGAAKQPGAAGGEVPEFGEEKDHTAAAPAQSKKPAEAARRTISVHTDTFDLKIDMRGASIVKADLPKYPVDLDHPDQPFVLLNDTGQKLYIVQGGILSKQDAPTHEAEFHATQQSYTMAPGQDRLEVPLTWNDDGIKVTKVFDFQRGSYLIDIRYEVKNDSATTWRGRGYVQVKRSKPEKKHHSMVRAYTGAVISSPDDRYKKLKFDEIQDQKLQKDIINGWAAMQQHYFLTAILPPDKSASYRYYTSVTNGKYYSIGAISPQQQAAPGKTALLRQQIYVGPKVQDRLAQIADGLDLTVDYGILWFLAKPVFWCLKELHGLTGNWGWAIILVTVFLKLLFYRLSAAGYRSMAKMRQVQPRMKAARERYKDDKSRLNQAMMEIYKEEKINPLGGCLPIVIQIPVFIALYWVLLGSIELRQAPFIFWIRDLSAPDPYWVLPLIMGITMFIQQRLNPAPMDPIQQKVMMALPFAFTIFFGFFPSGLVLYWVVNNILSIIQQWRITQNLERAGLSVRKK
ncbi:MAG: membrane protein insertase YidC [Gammaproteobacteria bacterium]|jgi:YidC/Oxa1 family membrane protein insertase